MVQINEEKFREVVDSATPSVVDFSATWCMPCKIFAPVLEELSDELDGKADFYKVDLDESQELAQELGISLVPTVVIFKDGAELERFTGVQAKDFVLGILKKYI